MNEPQAVPDGRRDVDFLLGRWRLHNRRLVDLLDRDCAEWVQFEAAGQGPPDPRWARQPRQLLSPSGPPDGRPLEAVTLRLFDPASGLWRIWWTVTSRPGHMDPPVQGRLAGGYGRFHSDDVLDGQPIKVRFIWKDITATSARFKQALSYDGGRCWQTNWVIILTQLGQEDDHG
jgi:hypothetical protein